MAMLTFFPWFTIAEPVSVGPFSLVPWHRGRGQPNTGQILGSYVEPWGTRPPVESATLLQLGSGELTRDLSEEERARVFEFGEFVAFAGLARREFFGRGTYVNRDSFAMIVQGFTPDDAGGVAVVARRRDGRTRIYSPRGYWVRPAHVSEVTVRLDAGVLRALVTASDGDSGVNYDEAIFSFNIANTDAESAREQNELVSMTGAFERLLDARGKADDLASKLSQLIAPFVPDVRAKRLERIVARELLMWRGDPDKFRPSATLTEAWARDLYRVRNAFGHGRKRNDKPTIWPSASAHLLLGAYLFPLAVLVRLSNEGYYSLTDSDRVRLRAFGYLASLRQPLRCRRVYGESVWNAALTAADNADRWERASRAWDEAVAKRAAPDSGS